MKQAISKLSVLCFLVLATAGSGWALELDQAKQRGVIGEKPNGYLGIVSPPGSKEVKALIAEVNSKRRKHYQKIAKTRKTEISVVEKIGGKTAIEKTLSGHFVLLPSGEWGKKQ